MSWFIFNWLEVVQDVNHDEKSFHASNWIIFFFETKLNCLSFIKLYFQTTLIWNRWKVFSFFDFSEYLIELNFIPQSSA